MKCVICKNGTTENGLVNVPIVRKDKIIFIKIYPLKNVIIAENIILIQSWQKKFMTKQARE